jgi:cytochrome c556
MTTKVDKLQALLNSLPDLIRDAVREIGGRCHECKDFLDTYEW